MTKAITPREACVGKATNIPDVVIEVVNQMLKDRAPRESMEIVLGQDEIVKKLVARGLDRHELFEKGWLDFESAYQKAGWIVEYDKPGYNETYPATFTFKAKKHKGLE